MIGASYRAWKEGADEAVLYADYRNAFKPAAIDFGFELGGPLLDDRVRFYVGFAPTLLWQSYDRVLRARSAMDLPAGQTDGSWSGDVDPSQPCPAWTPRRSTAP